MLEVFAKDKPEVALEHFSEGAHHISIHQTSTKTPRRSFLSETMKRELALNPRRNTSC